jgi:tripartite motif-containing protein 71
MSDIRGEESRVIETLRVVSVSNGVAVTRDGSALLLTDFGFGSHAVHEIRLADGWRRAVGYKGDGPLQFNGPRQLWIAPDDEFVFVADCDNHRVQVLTPRLDFHGFVGVGALDHPAGVCANADVVVVSDQSNRVSVFSRRDGTLLRRFGSEGSGRGQLHYPLGLCFMAGDRHVAVADCNNSRVSVFSVDTGEFIRDVGEGELLRPQGVACSAHDELIVADTEHDRVVVFGASGAVLKTMGRDDFGGVAIHGGAIYAVDSYAEKCVVFT